MASLRNNLTADMFACGVDIKRGTCLFAVVLGLVSMLLVIIFGVKLSEFIEHEHKDKQIEATLIFGIVLYGTHALSCGLVVLAVKTGCRFILIPWLVVACVMLALAFRSMWSVIVSYLGFSGGSERNRKSSPVFQACFNMVVILLFFGFGRCVSKVYKILRAESAMKELYRQNLRSQTVWPAEQQHPQNPDIYQPPPYTENYQPQQYHPDQGNYHLVQDHSMPGMVDPPPPQYNEAVHAQEKSVFDSPPPKYSDVT